MSTISNGDDLFWRHLKTLPAFRALLRAVEARLIRQVELSDPILDLGCGDGHFAQYTFDKSLRAGVDPWWGPLVEAKQRQSHDIVVQAIGQRMPFSDQSFRTVISNSVLEHILDIDPVLREASRLLVPGGRFVLTMPCHNFTKYLGGALFLERLGLVRLANLYRRIFNSIARHAHTDPPDTWSERLARFGLTVETWHYYFSKEALRALEIGHIQGLPSAILHFLTGHWIIAPSKNNLYLTEKWLRPFYEERIDVNNGTMVIIIAQKKATYPVSPTLPPPNKLSQSPIYG